MPITMDLQIAMPHFPSSVKSLLCRSAQCHLHYELHFIIGIGKDFLFCRILYSISFKTLLNRG